MNEVEALRVRLMELQKAQWTAKIALANGRVSNVAEGGHSIIDRMRHDRDQAQAALEKAQRAVRGLEQQVTRLVREHRRLGLMGSQLSISNSCLRYSPFPTNFSRHNHPRPARALCSPATPMFAQLNPKLSPASTGISATDIGRSDTSDCPSPLHSPPIENQRPRPPLQPIWSPRDVASDENACDILCYTRLGQLQPGIRIGINGVENPVDLHAYLWRYQLQRLQQQARDARHHYLYECVNDHVDAILRRRGRYAELVAALFPDAPLDFALDPVTSKLGSEYMFDVSSLADEDDIHEEDVARWMYAVLNISREAARLELEPYFRRRTRDVGPESGSGEIPILRAKFLPFSGVRAAGSGAGMGLDTRIPGQNSARIDHFPALLPPNSGGFARILAEEKHWECARNP